VKFHSLTTSVSCMESLEKEFKSGREIGIIRLGESCLFFRRHLKTFYIPYADIDRCFRRVLEVPMKMCCGKGEFQIEHLVICSAQKEVAQIQLPGTKAARILMEELKTKAPGAHFSSMKENEDKAKESSI